MADTAVLFPPVISHCGCSASQHVMHERAVFPDESAQEKGAPGSLRPSGSSRVPVLAGSVQPRFGERLPVTWPGQDHRAAARAPRAQHPVASSRERPASPPRSSSSLSCPLCRWEPGLSINTRSRNQICSLRGKQQRAGCQIHHLLPLPHHHSAYQPQPLMCKNPHKYHVYGNYITMATVKVSQVFLK